jgi:hypothetical protein
MITNLRNLTLTVIMVMLGFDLGWGQTTQVPVSGYELFTGHNCVIGSQPATCGATFSGWTGETSQEGWLAFPGTELGGWSIKANYIGKPAFGDSVTLVGGTWIFFLKNGGFLHGTITSGMVTWPSASDSPVLNSNCGDGVATVAATLSVAGGHPALLAGCLHDLPAGTVIPPKVWGEFIF